MEENQSAESVEQAPAAVKEQEPKKNDAVQVCWIAAIIVAIALCVGYFLPYTSMTDESREKYSGSSIEIVEGSGITWSDMEDPSFVTWGHAYWAIADYTSTVSKVSLEHNGYMWNFVGFAISGGLAVIALICALARKATPTVLFSLLNVFMLSIISAYFEESGPVAGGNSVWAFGHTYMVVVLAMLMFAGVSLFCAKRKAKRSAK